MRRIHSIAAASVLLVLSSAACSAIAGPLSPEPLSKLSLGAGVETSQTRAAVVQFLNAYTAAATDQAKSLQKLVDSNSPAGVWAAIVKEQDREFQGSISGSLDIHSIGTPEVPPATAGGTSSQPLRILQVNASVGFTFTPDTGQPIQQTRNFDGPMALLEAAPGTWQVVDFTRDGQPLDNILAPLGSSIPRSGVTLHLVAEVFDSQAWELLVVIQNGTSTLLKMSSRSVFLANGPTSIVAAGSITKSLASVPAGAKATGLVSVPAQASTPSGLVYVIVVDPAKGKPIPFVLQVSQLQAAISNPVGGGSPTPAPSASTGPLG